MASVTVESIGPCKKRLNIEVPVEYVKQEIEKIYAEIARTAKIPGFRPGKVPRKILESRYKNDVYTETQKRVVSHFYESSLKEKKLIPVRMPSIEPIKFDPDQPLAFTAELEVAPIIELKNYEGIKVKVNKISLADDEVNSYLDRIREQQAVLEAVSGRPAAYGDFLVVDYTITDLKGKLIEEGKEKLMFMQKGESPIGHVISALDGMTIDQVKKVETTLPDNYQKKEFANQKAALEIKLLEIKEKVLPEVTDDFAKSLGKFETKADLVEEIKKALAEQKKVEQRRDGAKQIEEYLADQYRFDLPQTVVDAEYNALIRNASQAEDDAKELDEKQKKELRKQASDRVTVSYVLAEIAEKEKISVTEKELDAHIRVTAAQLYVKYEKFKAHLEETGGIYRLQERIIEDKVLDFLYSKARVAEK